MHNVNQIYTTIEKKKPLLIGITGGIGAGKSTVCRVFEWLGIPVYYADDQAKELIKSNIALKAQIKDLLGAKSYDIQGNYDRAYVGSLVFNDSKLLAKLNSLIHPAVANHFKSWVEQNTNKPYILKEAAILFESGSDKGLDKVIGVHATKSIRIERVRSRDQLSTKAIASRMKNQMSQAEKMKRCDYLVNNDGNTMIVPQVVQIHHDLLRSIGKINGQK